MNGSSTRKDQLARLLQSARVGWVLDGEDREARLGGILQEVDELAGRLSRTNLGQGDLMEEMARDVSVLAPLVQSFSSPMSTEIRTAIYLLLRGAELSALTYEYDRLARSRLYMRIATMDRRALEFESTELWDAEFLRHIGLMKMSGRPLVDGYYALRAEV
jgi:hypothetical protein